MIDKDEKMKKMIAEEALKVVRTYMQTSAFTDRKLTDTPTDNLSVVNKRYVTLNGLVANRPSASVASVGQSYFATDTNIPMIFSSTGWRNGVGSIVAGL